MAVYTDLTTVEKTNKDELAINNSIKNILLTRIGSVPGKPEFGSELMNIVFSTLDHITVSLLKNEIERALHKFEPRINIVKITVTEQPEYNRIIANIKYKYFNLNTYMEASTNIKIN